MGQQIIELADGISIRTYLKEEDVPGGVHKNALSAIPITPKLDLKTVYLCIEQSGYVGGYNEDPAFMEALSKVKQLLHLGVKRNFFSLKDVKYLGLASAISIEGKTYDNAIVFNQAEPDAVSCSVSIPGNISKYKEKIFFNKENKYYKIARKKDENAVIDYIKGILKRPAKLVSAPLDLKEAVSVKSAVEWAFEASVSENETIALLQTCMGLEAILGDDSDRESLTETLADRCAYLIADSIEVRKDIKKSFKELYRLRSKLVHGRAIRLKEHETGYLRWAKRVLNIAIEREMKHLELDKT
jgi:hypothetical protein